MNKIQKIHAVLCAILAFLCFVVGAILGGVSMGFFCLALAVLWWAVVAVIIWILTSLNF